MDVNEEIVRVWMQEQGFLVRTRLKFLKKEGKSSPGWSDVDIIGYRLHDSKRVAVDISAWMAETISMSYLRDTKIRHRLIKITEPESRNAIRAYFGIAKDEQYDIWLVVSKISEKQRDEIINELTKAGINRIIEFKEIMSDLLKVISKYPTLPREEESLQTIRALVLSGLL